MATEKPKQMSMMNYLLVMIAASVLVVGAAAVIGQGQVRDIIQQAKVQTAKTKADTQLDKDTQAATQLIVNYQGLGSTKTLIADALPTSADQPGFMAMMESVTKQSGMKLNSYSPAQASAVSGAALPAAGADIPAPLTTGATLSLSGSYQSLTKLLGNLEQSARPVRVNSISVSGGGSNLSVQLDMTTYYQDKATLPFKTEVVK